MVLESFESLFSMKLSRLKFYQSNFHRKTIVLTLLSGHYKRGNSRNNVLLDLTDLE